MSSLCSFAMLANMQKAPFACFPAMLSMANNVQDVTGLDVIVFVPNHLKVQTVVQLHPLFCWHVCACFFCSSSAGTFPACWYRAASSHLLLPFLAYLRAGTPMVAFMFGHLIDVAGQLAAQRLCAMADAVWPPGGGKEVWLRGMLAKWLMNAGFIGDGPEGSKVLRAVLAIGPESATVFRIEMGQAGE